MSGVCGKQNLSYFTLSMTQAFCINAVPRLDSSQNTTGHEMFWKYAPLPTRPECYIPVGTVNCCCWNSSFLCPWKMGCWFFASWCWHSLLLRGHWGISVTTQQNRKQCKIVNPFTCPRVVLSDAQEHFFPLSSSEKSTGPLHWNPKETWCHGSSN